MKKILCPTDFSDTANNAISYAAKFAQWMDAEITLFNVQSLFELSPGELLEKDLPEVQWAREMLEDQARTVESECKISCQTMVSVSDFSLSSMISEKAKEYDLIIMGTGGPDDLNQFFFGTHTYKVFQKAKVPIILVPETVQFAVLNRIVYAYDFLHHGIPPVTQFQHIMKNYQGELNFLQLSHESPDEDDQQKMLNNEKIIKEGMPSSLDISFDLRVTDDFFEALQKYLLTSDADLLVLGTHSYTLTEKLFHKSLAKRIFMDFLYPVFVVHI
jgi:nucleotide-binding universal stress UspA family protein